MLPSIQNDRVSSLVCSSRKPLLFFFTKRHTLSLLEYISFKFKDDRILPEMMDLLSWNQKL